MPTAGKFTLVLSVILLGIASINSEPFFDALNPMLRFYLGLAAIFVLGVVIGAFGMLLMMASRALRPALLRGARNGGSQ